VPTRQNPLTGTPAPSLDWSRDRTPASTKFDDIYFSVDGGLEESQNIFLKANNLPERWMECEIFCIGELGFGSGLNFLACWDLWQQTAPSHARLHFISIEAYPWTAEELKQALQHFPDLSEFSDQLIAQWPGQVKGLHRLHFDNISLTLMHMDVDEALNQYDGPGIDAWFLDGFSPEKNPKMWSPAIFSSLARLSADGATIGTFTVAGHVRRGLQDAGFTVVRKPGFSRKRHRLEAHYKAVHDFEGPPKKGVSPIIIGLGIGGASIAKAFARRGIKPMLIEPAPDLSNAASGNPAALVMPRLDLQDRPESRFFLNAYLYATRTYDQDGHVLQTGAVQLAKSEDEQKRFEKVAAQSALPQTEMQLILKEDAEKFLGLPIDPPFSGLKFLRAQTIDPIATINLFTKACERIEARISKIINQEGEWVVSDDKNNEIARSPHVFVTAGADILQISGLDNLPVRFTRGQISWGTTDTIPDQPVTFGGYAMKYKNGIMLGATHDHVDAGQSGCIRVEDDQQNIDKFETLTGQKIDLLKPKSRAGIRVTTKDTLPISTQLNPGLFVMTGLGSRGFMMAPLLGEALVCQALGEISPLTIDTKMRFGTREKT
jgi:tRNA 5-methylaminomethyl-2-thiouridine biosynthesis bifunctional protein